MLEQYKMLPWVALIILYPLSPVTDNRSSDIFSWGAVNNTFNFTFNLLNF